MGTRTPHGLTSGAAGGRVSRPPARRKATYVALDPAPAITHDEIATRAYEIYEARGNDAGDALGDWLAAERELRHRAGTAAATPVPASRDVYH